MTVLNSYTLVNKTFLWYLIAVLFVSTCVGVWFIWEYKKFYKKTRIILSAIAGVVVIGCVFTLSKLYTKTNYIECTISDEYPAKKLYETYNVIEKRGDIWVLSFKKPSEVKNNDRSGD